MWFLAIAAVGLLALLASSGTPSNLKIKLASIPSSWATFVVFDNAKLPVDVVPTGSQYTGANAAVATAMVQMNPSVAAAAVGTIPVFISGVLATNQHVWVGPTIQDETSKPPGTYVPIYVGTAPPSGYVEVVA